MARTDELLSASLGILMPRITSTDFDEVMTSSCYRATAIITGPIPQKAGTLLSPNESRCVAMPAAPVSGHDP